MDPVLTKVPPTLEDLRQAPQAAWLWDGARGRIVWANQAGIKLFDGQSMFDLIDRPFDAREAGIETITDLTRSLQRGEIKQALLSFPSVGLLVPIECKCNLHSLADGRAGLLVVEMQAEVAALEASPGFMAMAFQHMPVAVGFVDEDGRFSNLNAAAASLFSANRLSALLNQPLRADDILKRMQSSALVSQVETINGVLGVREVRMTLQRLPEATGPFAMMLLDDVTERRALERQMATPLQSPAQDALAFENLAKALNDTIKQDSVVKAAKLEVPKQVIAAAIVPKPAAMHIPKTMLNALEQTGAAIAISKDGKPAFVSKKAATLLGYEKAADLFQDETFWTSLKQIKTSSTKVDVQVGTGQSFQLAAKTTNIPWLSGPAQQIVFEALKSEKPKELAKPKPVESAAVLVPVETSVAPSTVEIAADDDLKRILDIASDGIVTLDREGRVLSFSAGAEAMFGYRTAEVLNKPLVDFFAPESHKLFTDYLAGLEGPGLAAVFNDGREMLGIVKQGGTVPMFITLGRMSSGGSRAAYAVVLRDITTWKRTEKELREAKDVAEEASRQKSEFLARISHELRTPLNAIIGFSEVMRMGQFGEIKNAKYRDYIDDIHTSGGHLLSLINDLLDLSKIEAGKLELNFTAVSVADAAEHAIRLLQEVATRGRVLVRKSLPDNLPRVVADLRALRQVMLNVLSNAIKFTDPGGQVIISAQLTRDGELALSIKDTGIGMNTAQIKDALEPFKRVETAGRETQGTGLGLSLTKALVEANRAKFSLSSESGRGTLIEILFPTTRVLAE